MKKRVAAIAAILMALGTTGFAQSTSEQADKEYAEQELQRFKESFTNRANMMQIIDTQVRVVGTVAVVNSTFKVVNPYDYDLYPTGDYQVTNIYTKEKGKWYLSLSHWTTIVE